jgi:TonB-linked SusC/RagA family outer membrane protein
MRFPCCAVLAALALPLGGVLSAQERTVSGAVVDSATGEPVANADILVKGTLSRVVTRVNGQFILTQAPSPAFTLVVRAIGFRRREVPVAVNQTDVMITLGRDVFKLEELVITGQATGIEKQNLPNAVATVSGDELTRVPSQTLESALQGKIPGALIQANSGAPGGGIQVSLRGTSTINGGAEPLFVVDGIVVSNVSIPNGADAVTASRAGGNPTNQDNAVNRIADLNPNDIERIEVLKGGSAAAIYGSKATNGVIIITTRRGQTGVPRFNITQRFGFSSVANSLGSRVFADSAEAASVYNPSLVGQFFTPGVRFDNEGELYGRKALSTETSASLSGGTDLTRYYISGLIKNDEGIAINTDYRKEALRVNLDQNLGSRYQVSVSTNVIHSRSNRGLSNNDNSGTSPFLVFPFTPNFVDLRRQGADTFPDNPFQNSNPLETFTFLKNEEDVWRALGIVTTRYAAVSNERHNLNFIVVGGADYFNQKNDFVSPPELEYEPNDGQPGTVVFTKASNLNLNLAVNGTHAFTPGSGRYQTTTSFGVQYEDRDLNSTQILGRTLLTGQTSVDQAASRDPSQDIQRVKDLGIFGQEEVLLLDRRLLLTVGLRADRSSSNGNPDKFSFFPKAATSYRLIRPFGFLDEIKLRAAYGQTGNQPLFGQKFTPDTSGIIDGNFGVFVGQRVGDPGIEPERQKEIEAGFDATFSGDRATLSFSVYQRNISNLLLEQTLAPSTGQLNRIFNSGGTLRNRGVEIELAVYPVRTADLSWLFRTTFFANRSRITELPGGTFQAGGFGTSLGGFQIEEGKSVTQIVGTEGVVGDASPDFQMSFSSDVRYKRFTLGALLDWKKGGDIVNLTEFLYDIGRNSADVADGGGARFGEWASGKTAVYVQDGSYVKLREVSLSYEVPEDIVGRVFGSTVRYGRITLQGRNLLRSTGYRGLDPEVSNFGNQAIFRSIDVAPFPPSRSFFLSIDLGF